MFTTNTKLARSAESAFQRMSKDCLRWYELRGRTGVMANSPFEMLESEALADNLFFSEAGSNLRWFVVAEKGAR